MDNKQTTIFIGNLPFTTTEEDLREAFTPFGAIINIHIPMNRETQQPRGFAFLEFETEESAQEALSTNGQEFNGRSMKVSIAQGKKESSDRPRTGGGNRYGSNNRGGSSNGGGFSRDRNRRF